MASPEGKPNRPRNVQEFELVQITDPLIQGALDRLRRGQSTKQDRKLLSQPEKKTQTKGGRGR
jgi:hypothetical protein